MRLKLSIFVGYQSSGVAAAAATGTTAATSANKGYLPDEALHLFGAKLTAYEHTEIYNYQRVYFVGSQAKKRVTIAGAANNANFDDENGSYVLVPHDHVAYRYEILKVIGKGSFGQVSDKNAFRCVRVCMCVFKRFLINLLHATFNGYNL